MPRASIKKIASARKRQFFVIFLLVAGIIGFSLLGTSKKSGITVHASRADLSTLVADTDALREQGLSGREPLGKNQTMLFIFDNDSRSGFWMKDMKFSIDIVWLDVSKKVVTIKDNASPESYPEVFYPTSPARYVLELDAGRASELGIAPGTTLQW